MNMSPDAAWSYTWLWNYWLLSWGWGFRLWSAYIPPGIAGSIIIISCFHVVFLQLLIDAMARQELAQVILLLADSNPDEVSAPYSGTDRRTALHIAAQQGNAIFLQLLLWVRLHL